MLNELRTFFDHSRHSLNIQSVDAPLDVLAFTGEEALSQTFAYRIEFTSSTKDLAADDILGKDASFSLRAPPEQFGIPGYTPPLAAPLRTLHGVITAFKRIAGSRDEAHYEVTLEPRLKLLSRGRQYRIYQNQSVPEIVEQVLRRHDLRGQDFLIELTREYAQREMVMQFGEDDLAFIQRLTAEVGIWYRFSMDARLKIDVCEFSDDQRHYLPAPPLPLRPLSSLESSGKDAVWGLQASHQVVEQRVTNRAYYHRDAAAQLDAAADLIRSPKTTYGEPYHYADTFKTLGDPYAQDEDLESESAYFYARLAHERYLNQRTRLTGFTSSPAIAPGQVLKINGAPEAFAPGAVIVRLYTSAARDRSYEVQFEAIPYAEHICFRPDVPPKPVIAGTIPARITSPEPNDLYGHIDMEGRYRVSFLFDRDEWKPGQESCWLRLARPYAGDTFGLHLPLIQGTEVRVAFAGNGDPDQPYIAHAIHDSQHPDHVTLRNYKRNVLRTPANNKLKRLHDKAKQDGSTCLDDQWNGQNSHYRFRCQHDPSHEWTRSYTSSVRDSVCPLCVRRAGALRRVSSKALPRLQAYAKGRGGECLSTVYRGQNFKYLFRCSEGHTWEAVAANVLKNQTWCFKCRRKGTARRLDIDDARRLARSRGGEFLSAQFMTNKDRYTWRCARGHVWEARYARVRGGGWCLQCGKDDKAADLEPLQQAAVLHGGQCLSEAFLGAKAKHRWQCSKGHVWEALFYTVRKGHWCAQCAKDSKWLTLADMHEAAARHGGQCLADAYFGAAVKYRWQCARGHTWDTTFGAVRAGHWCPICVYMSYTKTGSAAWRRYQAHGPKD
ncbi:type VI secretion system Vgr family protein [Pseudomonas sp. NY15437]|uniref:type VI secretion system Vgr family protein n=1 Tax=Pseudomonas sp. NY15437 TaxID=3400360 RepID=UPI003A8B724D